MERRALNYIFAGSIEVSSEILIVMFAIRYSKGSVNTTSSDQQFQLKWRLCWSLYSYPFGIAFLLTSSLCVASIVSFIRKSRFRLTIRNFLLVSLAVGSLLRSITLFTDFHGSNAGLPCLVVRSVEVFDFPCTIAFLALFNRLLQRLTDHSTGKTRTTYVLISAYLCVVVALVAITCRKTHFTHLVLLQRCLFVVVATILCCAVCSKCLRLHRHIERTAMAKRQIFVYLRSKRCTTERGTSPSSRRRIKRLTQAEEEERCEGRRRHSDGGFISSTGSSDPDDPSTRRDGTLTRSSRRNAQEGRRKRENCRTFDQRRLLAGDASDEDDDKSLIGEVNEQLKSGSVQTFCSSCELVKLVK